MHPLPTHIYTHFNGRGTHLQCITYMHTFTLRTAQTALVFDSAVASLEIVGCQSVQVQVVKVVPIINVDKTDGVQIFLSREAVGVTEFIAAKYSEMNIVIPGATDNDDIVCFFLLLMLFASFCIHACTRTVCTHISFASMYIPWGI